MKGNFFTKSMWRICIIFKCMHQKAFSFNSEWLSLFLLLRHTHERGVEEFKFLNEWEDCLEVTSAKIKVFKKCDIFEKLSLSF